MNPTSLLLQDTSKVQMNKSTERKCSLCHKPGHTKRKCGMRVEDRTYTYAKTKKTKPTKKQVTISPKPRQCCSICLEYICTTYNNVTTPCNHHFCFTCIVKHLETSKSCPNCRSSLKKQDEHKPKKDVYMVPIGNGTSVPLSSFISEDDYDSILSLIQDLSPNEVSGIIADIIASRNMQ